jgi:uncharacterized membrane protein
MKTKTLKKVICWRAVSISLTYLVTYMLTGSVKEATGFTLLLHAILLAANYVFEILWERYVSKNN